MAALSKCPHYDLTELIRACKREVKSVKGKVRVRKQAKLDAKEFFHLETESKIIAFIAIGDFQSISHENTDELEHDPDKGVLFDAYIFRIGPVKNVYFAFYKRANGTWIIKSFHPPEYGGGTPFHLPFVGLKEIIK